MAQITATKCDRCGRVHQGYAPDDWLSLKTKKFGTTYRIAYAHFCDGCKDTVIAAISDAIGVVILGEDPLLLDKGRE